MSVNKDAKTNGVVIDGSPNVNAAYTLVGNAQYPTIAQEFQRTFRALKHYRTTCFTRRIRIGSYIDMDKK
jgi:metallo-beta-lactamase class B